MRDSEEARTFETRLLFIKDIFEHKYSQEDVLKKSIEYKLRISYEQYLEDLKGCMRLLTSRNPLTVLKKTVKEMN